MQERDGTTKKRRAICCLDGSDKPNAVSVETWRDLLFEVRRVLNDSGNSKRDLCQSCRLDRRYDALVWVNAAKERQIGAGSRVESKSAHVDSVMDGGHIIKGGM